MAFTVKQWEDRVSEYPNRFTFTKDDGTSEIVTVTRNNGDVSKEGDAFSKENMDGLETRIAGAFDDVDTEMTELKKSVSDGKTKVATAITGKGVATASDASFDTMTNNINNIATGAVWTSSPVNIQSKFPAFWQRLRTSDFICGVTSASAHSQVGHESKSTGCGKGTLDASATISYSYNNSTGILSFSAGGQSKGSWDIDSNDHGLSIGVGGVFCAYRGTISG